MVMRRVNKSLLRERLQSEKGLKVRAANEAGCSVGLIEKMMTEAYTSEPREYYCQGISRALHEDIDVLFPLARTGGSEAS